MLELVALLLSYLAVALHYGATRVRGRARFTVFERSSLSALARLLALVALAVAVAVSRRSEPLAAAGLVVASGIMVVGPAVTLLGALAPRALGISVWMAAAALPVLAWFGGLR